MHAIRKPFVLTLVASALLGLVSPASSQTQPTRPRAAEPLAAGLIV